MWYVHRPVSKKSSNLPTDIQIHNLQQRRRSNRGTSFPAAASAAAAEHGCRLYIEGLPSSGVDVAAAAASWPWHRATCAAVVPCYLM